MNQHSQLTLILFPQRMAVSKMEPGSKIPDWVEDNHFLSLTYTQDEMSIVCEEKSMPDELLAERGWRLLQVQGPLEFSMVGVLANICTTLAKAGVSAFVVSTFETDYILVKEDVMLQATNALVNSGYQVMDYVSIFK